MNDKLQLSPPQKLEDTLHMQCLNSRRVSGLQCVVLHIMCGLPAMLQEPYSGQESCQTHAVGGSTQTARTMSCLMSAGCVQRIQAYDKATGLNTYRIMSPDLAQVAAQMDSALLAVSS